MDWSFYERISGGITKFFGGNPLLAGAGLGAAAAGGIVGLVAASSSSSGRKKTSSKRKKTGRSRDWRYASQQKHEVAYRKRRRKLKKKSYQKYYKRKGVKYTKNGQPYIITSSGKAKFIKRRR